MENLKVRISSYPIRIAQRAEDNYILYHTNTFTSIFLDSVSYSIWDFIYSKKETYTEDSASHIVELYGIKDKTPNQVYDDFSELIDFLIQNTFLERTETIEGYQKAI